MKCWVSLSLNPTYATVAYLRMICAILNSYQNYTAKPFALSLSKGDGFPCGSTSSPRTKNLCLVLNRIDYNKRFWLV